MASQNSWPCQAVRRSVATFEAVERHNVETDLMVWSESSVTSSLEQSKELKTVLQNNRLDAVIIANFSEIGRLFSKR